MIELGILAVVTITVGVIGLVMFLDVRDAEQRCANARVDAQLNAGKLALAAADATTWKYKALTEERRANALDDLIAKHAGSDAGPVAGSFERLLEEWRSARKVAATANGPGPDAVPAPPAAGTSGPGLGLVKPGDI